MTTSSSSSSPSSLLSSKRITVAAIVFVLIGFLITIFFSGVFTSSRSNNNQAVGIESSTLTKTNNPITKFSPSSSPEISEESSSPSSSPPSSPSSSSKMSSAFTINPAKLFAYYLMTSSSHSSDVSSSTSAATQQQQQVRRQRQQQQAKSSLTPSSSIQNLLDDHNIHGGECYPDAHRTDIWSPVNCPDDSYWLRLWLKARSDILAYSLKHPTKSAEMVEKYFPNFAQSTRLFHQKEGSHSTIINKNIKNSILKQHPYSRLNEWLLVDVGANKGFTLSKWTESLVGASRSHLFNSFRLMQEAYNETSGPSSKPNTNNNNNNHGEKRHRISAMCGACVDCVEEEIDFESEQEFNALSPLGKFQKGKNFFGTAVRSEDEESKNPAVKFLGLEPVQANFDFLKKFFVTGDEIYNSNSTKVREKTKIFVPSHHQHQQRLSSDQQQMVGSNLKIDSSKDDPFYSTSHANNINPQSKYYDIRNAAASLHHTHGNRLPFRAGPFGVETHSFKSRTKLKKKDLTEHQQQQQQSSPSTSATSNSMSGFTKFVDVLSLDKLLLSEDSPYKDRYIDVLTTDTEGFDLDVAEGAETLLFSNRVKMYIFELHQKSNYTRVFKKLEQVGNYECYYPAQPTMRGITLVLPHLIRITGSCFNQKFEKLSGWMNAVCVNKVSAPELVDLFGRLTKVKRQVSVPGGTEEQRIAAFAKAEKWLDSGKRV